MRKALLVALIGLFFSHYAVANSCAALANQTETFTLPAGSSCGATNEYQISPDQCCNMNFAGSGEFDDSIVCNYRYTGSSCSQNDSPMYTELNPIDNISLGVGATQPPELLSFQAHYNYTELKTGIHALNNGLRKLSANDNVINTNVLTLSDRMSQVNSGVNSAKNSSDAAKASADAAKASANAAKSTIDSVLLQTQEMSPTLALIHSSMPVMADIDNSLSMFEERLKTALGLDLLLVHDSLAQSVELNTDEVLAAVDEVKQQVSYIGSTLDDPITREAKHRELLDGIYYSTSDIADIKNYSNETIGLLYEILDSGGGGGGGDMQQTNDILNGIKADANNNTNRIVNAVNNSEGLANIENQLMQTNGRLGGLSGQLGQQLDDIKLAIENSPGGGDGSIPDDLMDVTNQELSQLRQLVAANHTASQAQLQNLNTTASGQSEQLASLSTAVSGIGESLDDIKSGLSGPAYESPGMSDSDIKDSLGVGDIAGREDLFTDDIELDSFTGSYTGWISTSTCPDIPAFELPFGIDWKLDFTLFCDILGIFGVFVMAAAYFSVPFIVFGGKK